MGAKLGPCIEQKATMDQISGKIDMTDTRSWVHCHLRLGCLIAGPAAWAVQVLAGESFGRVIGERCPNLATDTLSRSG